MHTTFQYLRFRKGKRFELYLSLTGFQLLDFSSFSLFTGELSFPGAGWNQHLAPTLDLSKLKILLQISLTRVDLFGAKILSTNHSTFPLPPPRRITPPDWPWLLSFQQAKVQRVRLTYPFSPLPLQRSVFVIRSFLMPIDSNKEGYWPPLLSLSLSL